jgi:hypothetical protein
MFHISCANTIIHPWTVVWEIEDDREIPKRERKNNISVVSKHSQNDFPSRTAKKLTVHPTYASIADPTMM